MRRKIFAHASVLALIVPISCHAVETLCTSTETVYFSCRVNQLGRLVSLCGSSLEAPEIFTLQYRIGKRNQLELAYPVPALPFSTSIFEVGHFRRPRGFDTEVSFSHSGWSYTIFHWAPPADSDPAQANNDKYRSGVFVGRNKSAPGTTVACLSSPYLGKNDAFFTLAVTYGKE